MPQVDIRQSVRKFEVTASRANSLSHHLNSPPLNPPWKAPGLLRLNVNLAPRFCSLFASPATFLAAEEGLACKKPRFCLGGWF